VQVQQYFEVHITWHSVSDWSHGQWVPFDVLFADGFVLEEYTGPTGKASEPDPDNNAENISIDKVLSWTPGIYAQDVNGHDVYLGTNWQDVNDADISDTTGIYRGRQDGNSYNPGGLEYGETYYWRIDEVNDACSPYLWKGDVWAFTTIQPIGNFHGHARFEKIKGDPSWDHVELYEYKAFLSPNGNGTGYSYHCGDPGTALHPYEGCITIRDIPIGTYSLMASWGEFFPRGKVVSDVVIAGGGAWTERNADQPIDYSGYLTKSSWDSTGGDPVYQTFVATGTSIVRASFQKADSSSDGQINFSIHEDNGGNVENWPQVGPTRSVNRGGYGADHWVAWQAGEVSTVPGRKYAIRLDATSGVNIQPYWSNDSLYSYGTGYRESQSNPANHDYYIVVFSDNDGTIATMMVRSCGYTHLAGWYDRWAQSYTARGTSLAGAALMGTLGGGSGWDFSVRVTVHSGSPNGPQVGPTKVMPCAYAPFAGVAGVCYSRGEVPTTIGETYWIVYEREGGGGFNAYRMNEGDVYSGGTAAYYDGSWHSQSFDLWMNLYEYKVDLDANNWVDSIDYALFVEQWLATGIGLPADFDNDYVVDMDDLAALVADWLK
jgi:hypothetical protein